MSRSASLIATPAEVADQSSGGDPCQIGGSQFHRNLRKAAALAIAAVPALRDPLLGVLENARTGVLPIFVGLLFFNAVAAELFFRGGLYAAAGGQHAVLITTFVFALTTVATGIPAVVVGAAALGAVVGLQRRVTGGVLAPIITHLTWLTGMVFLLPTVLTFWL